MILAFGAACWAAIAAEKSVKETRRIGEAQVRAYVDVPSMSVIFTSVETDDIQPFVRIVAKNTGQSPAKNFIWKPTLQYFGFGDGDARREREYDGKWREVLGIGISVGQEHIGVVIIPEMHLDRFLRTQGGTVAAVIVCARIEYEFQDVFDQTMVDEAYFMGIYHRRSDGWMEDSEYGRTQWQGKLTRGHKPDDWSLSPVPLKPKEQEQA